MKLIHLCKYYWPDNGGGIAAAMDMVIHAFREYSKDKDNLSQEIVCCWQKSGKPSQKDAYNEIPVYRCKSWADFASTQISPQFIRIVGKKIGKDDVAIYNFPYPIVDVAVLLGRVQGKLVVWWHCDFDSLKGKLITAFYRPLVRHTLKKADAIIVSASGNIDGSETLKQFRDKCHIIPFAVNGEMLEAGREYYFNSNRASDDGKVHILFIGRFVWYKGIEILLRAFSELDNSIYELTLIGVGPLFDNMKALAGQLGIDNASFVGSVSEEEKMDWIKWSDYLVLPSLSKAEAFAIVQIEAMAFGKPVINTYIPSGVPDVCPNDICGITVEKGNVAALSDAMRKLGEDKEYRLRLGQNSIDRVKELYSPEVLVEKYTDFFDSLNIS